jgi:hypothetical protein
MPITECCCGMVTSTPSDVRAHCIRCGAPLCGESRRSAEPAKVPGNRWVAAWPAARTTLLSGSKSLSLREPLAGRIAHLEPFPFGALRKRPEQKA